MYSNDLHILFDSNDWAPLPDLATIDIVAEKMEEQKVQRKPLVYSFQFLFTYYYCWPVFCTRHIPSQHSPTASFRSRLQWMRSRSLVSTVHLPTRRCNSTFTNIRTQVSVSFGVMHSHTLHSLMLVQRYLSKSFLRVNWKSSGGVCRSRRQARSCVTKICNLYKLWTPTTTPYSSKARPLWGSGGFSRASWAGGCVLALVCLTFKNVCSYPFLLIASYLIRIRRSFFSFFKCQRKPAAQQSPKLFFFWSCTMPYFNLFTKH